MFSSICYFTVLSIKSKLRIGITLINDDIFALTALMGLDTLQMFVPHPSLGHRERRLFVLRNFMKSINAGTALWISSISLIICFNTTGKFMFSIFS